MISNMFEISLGNTIAYNFTFKLVFIKLNSYDYNLSNITAKRAEGPCYTINDEITQIANLLCVVHNDASHRHQK